MNNLLPRLIVLEGLDGSGTSTQLDRAEKYVRAKYRQIKWHTTAEPQRTGEGVVPLRSYLKQNPMVLSSHLDQSRFFTMAFCADRIHHLNGEALQSTRLNQDCWTICDRYTLSTLAYQAFGLGSDHTLWVENLISIFPHPGLTIYLRVRPHACLKRIKRRSEETEIYETLETLTRVSDGYEAYLRWYDGDAQGDVGRVVVVDGEGSQAKVWARVRAELDRYIGLFRQQELPFGTSV